MTDGASDLHRIAFALRVDAAAARAIEALRAEGVETILLKGSSHGFLARPGETRYYVDVDLLIDPAQSHAAQSVLARLDYRSLTEGAAVAEESDYGWTWVKDGEPAIDLHMTMPLVGAAPAQAWSRLRADAVTHEVGGTRSLALSPTARLLQVALHVAKAGPLVASPSWDLHRAIQRPVEEWAAARELARDLDAMLPFAAGLRSTFDGQRLADDLGLSTKFPLSLDMRSHSAPAAARSVGLFLDASGRDRLRILRYGIVPTPTIMRTYHWPAQRGGRLNLMAAYLLRPLVILAHAPRAAAAIRAARRRQRGVAGSLRSDFFGDGSGES